MPPTNIPLYRTLLDIAAIWTIATVGYYTVLPTFGITPSYNESPIALALYYLVWLAVSVYWFWNIFDDHLPSRRYLWRYLIISSGIGAALVPGIYTLTLLPAPDVLALSSLPDIVLATPWYLIPKAADILVQQTLIAVLVFALAAHLQSLKSIISAYAITFGGAHVVLFLLNNTATPLALILTVGAILSAIIFPYLILRVPGGLIWSYAIHLAFYIVLIALLHTLPAPHPFAPIKIASHESLTAYTI